MLVARQGGKAPAQGGSESATGLLACGGAQGELGEQCAQWGICPTARECGSRRAVLSHSCCLRDSRRMCSTSARSRVRRGAVAADGASCSECCYSWPQVKIATDIG